MAELCEAVDVPRFRESVVELHGSSLGQHVRHCLDHVGAFLAGMMRGQIDYDARERDAGLEDDPAVAAAVARRFAGAIDEAMVGQRRRHRARVRVRCACGLSGEREWQKSSLGRELQFLVSHGVHHLAMVASSCRLHGVPVPEDLGVAPSTLRHRARQTDAAASAERAD
jgi:hypothetical protein